MNRPANNRARVAIDHVEVLREHLKRGPLSDQLVFDAACMRLASAIEEISGAGEAVVEEAFGASWRRIRGTRNTIAHGYAFVDPRLIISAITNDLDDFEARLRLI